MPSLWWTILKKKRRTNNLKHVRAPGVTFSLFFFYQTSYSSPFLGIRLEGKVDATYVSTKPLSHSLIKSNQKAMIRKVDQFKHFRTGSSNPLSRRIEEEMKANPGQTPYRESAAYLWKKKPSKLCDENEAALTARARG